MNKHIPFWNKIAEKYSLKPVPDESIYQQKLTLTQERLQPHMRVLEIGCGTGTTALKHAPFVEHISATDFSPAMIDIAKSKARTQGVNNVTFECQDIDQLEHLDEKFDVIMAHSVLHLVTDKSAVIAQCYRLLKPGGYFISSTVCITGLMKCLSVIWPLLIRLGKVPPLYFFDADELANDHQRAGFAIEHQWRPSKTNSFLITRKPT